MTGSKQKQSLVTSNIITLKQLTNYSDLLNNHVEYQNTDTGYEGRESLNKKLYVHIGDITCMKLDAIVCSTQTDLRLPPIGLASAVLGKGGKGLQDKLNKIGHIAEGEAVVTKGFSLPCKNVVFTAGPPPTTHMSYEQRIQCLQQNYLSCLNIVKDRADIKSIVFPCLGVGGANIRLQDALQTAANTIREWLDVQDNFNIVENIVLCMYNDDQWNRYFEQLLNFFPYGKDLAGFDMEKVPLVTLDELKQPNNNVASSIYCCCYHDNARTTIRRHLQSIGNYLQQKLGSSQTTIQRFQNCVILQVNNRDGRNSYKLILYQGVKTNTLEVQIQYTKIGTDMNGIGKDIKDSLLDYLEQHLENITPFQHFIRCPLSSFGEVEGLLRMEDLHVDLSLSMQCQHPRSQQAHQVNKRELLQYWIYLDEATPPRSIDEFSWRSISNSIHSSGRSSPTPNPVQHSNVSVGDPRKPPKLVLTPESQSDKCDKLFPDLQLAIPVRVLDTESTTSSTVTSPICETCSCQSGSSTSRSTSNLSGSSASTGDVDVSEAFRNMSTNSETFRNMSTNSETDPKQLQQANIVGRQYTDHTGNGNPNLTPLGAVGGSDRAGVTGLSRQTSFTSCSILSEKQLMRIANNVGDQHLQFGLELGLSDAEVKAIRCQESLNVMNQGYLMLKKWSSKNGTNATFEKLTPVLRECEIDIIKVEEEIMRD